MPKLTQIFEQSNGKNRQSHTRLQFYCATSLLGHFDLLLNRHTATWNLFAKYYIGFTILLNASLCRSILKQVNIFVSLLMMSILVGLHHVHCIVELSVLIYGHWINRENCFYNNWVTSPGLIGQELFSIGVQTMQMTWLWRILVFIFLACAVFQVYRTFKGNGRKKVSMLLLKTHQQQFSTVWTLIDHRNDVKIFKTL